MLKKAMTLLLAAVILCSFANTGHASGPEKSGATARGVLYTYISYTSSSIDISSSGLATVSANMGVVPGTDSVRISLYLQRYENGWVSVQHWSDADENVTSFELSRSAYVSSGYNYRALAYLYAYEGSSTESATSTATEYF